MAGFTAKAIMKTFEDMLTEMPFDKITVSAVVSNCGISTNTFYYHYKDIYDLLGKWLDDRKEHFVEETKDIDDWYEQLKVVFHEIQENPKHVYHVFNSISRERLEQYLFVSVEPMFYEMVKKRAEGMNIEEQKLKGIASFCCYSFLGFFLKFLWLRMDVDIDTAMDRLSCIFQGALEYAFHNASGATGTFLV